MALKLLIDGLPAHAGNGVWMGPFEQIPHVQGFAPYDLIFLDSQMRVLHFAEMKPEDQFPSVSDQTASMLMLPYGSLAAVELVRGEALIFYIPDSPGEPPSPARLAAAEPAPGAIMKRGRSGTHNPVQGPVTPSNPGATDAQQPEPPKEPRIRRFLRWIDPTLVSPPEMRISVRRPSPELVAYIADAGGPQLFRIGDISSSGIYLLTEKRWQIGERFQLTLQREGPPQEDSHAVVKVDAETVRLGLEGIGMRFLLPLGMDLHLWESINDAVHDHSKPEYVVSEIRFAKAKALIRTICPSGSEAIIQLMEKELGVARMACAVDIILIAKELLAGALKSTHLYAHPGLVLRIIEHGSWAEEQLIKSYWAGLLASACTPDGKDISNLKHVDSFSLMRMLHFQLLAEASRRVNAGIETACPPDELTKITGVADLTPIYRAIGLLGELGLLEKSIKSTYAFGEKVVIAPTELGRNMMARCKGIRTAA